jgi:hypothetical protein
LSLHVSCRRSKDDAPGFDFIQQSKGCARDPTLVSLSGSSLRRGLLLVPAMLAVQRLVIVPEEKYLRCRSPHAGRASVNSFPHSLQR